MASRCRNTGHEDDASRWACCPPRRPAPTNVAPTRTGLAERWLDLVVSRLDRYAESHRRAHYVLLRDIDGDLLGDPLDLDEVASACSGVLTEPPLAERIHVCIVGIPDRGNQVADTRTSWGMSQST